MLRTLATIAACTGLGFGQAPAAWSDLPVPNGVANASVSSLGKVMAVADGGMLHCWSAASRSWQSRTFLPGSSLRLCNDLVLVVEPTAVVAFSAYANRFAAVPVSAQAQIVNPGGQNNDSLVLVLDGAALHAFSCFTGTWTSRTFANPVAAAVQRHVALVADGTLVTAIDAYTATWHDLVLATAPQTLSCDGMAAFAIAPQEVHAFSAMHGTWRSSPLAGGSGFVRGDDWGMFWSAGTMLGYSAHSGGFQGLATGALAAPAELPLCAVASTTAGLIAFSAPRGTFSPVLASAAARVTADGGTVLFAEAQQVTGYSAVTGTAQTIAFDSSHEQTAGVVGLAFDASTGMPICFSALTGVFAMPPHDVIAAAPVLTTTSALLPATGGAYVFAARNGTYVPLPTGPGVTLVGNPQSAVAAAYDTGAFHAFDGRTGAFVSTPRQSALAPSIAIWRTNMTIVDGGVVHGFAAQVGRFSSTTLPESFAGGRANSESGRVDTAHHVLAHSGCPHLAAWAQFPEFRRVQPIGTPTHLSMPLAGGGVAAVAAGFLTAVPTPVPGLGVFHLTAPLATVFLLSQPGDEFARVQLAIPPTPSLTGLELGFQALALPTAGSPYLGDAAAVYLL